MSNMASFGIELKYTKGLPVESFKYYGEPLPSTYAIAWCMMATGIYRIFTRDDLREFLLRLAITMHSMNLVEIWFLKDHLMDYKVKGKEYVLKLEDVAMHFGIEVVDSYKNLMDREGYFEYATSGIKGAMITGQIAGFSVLEPVKEDDTIYLKPVEDLVPEITPVLIKKAEYFASDLLRFIPDKMFTDRNPLIEEKERELESRRQKNRSLPVFDIEKIPREKIRECLEIIYKPEYAKKYFEDAEAFEKNAKPIIYLGWLYANDFLESDGIMLWEKEGSHLNHEDYILEDGGINLNVTIENYNIEDLVPLLKGLLIE